MRLPQDLHIGWFLGLEVEYWIPRIGYGMGGHGTNRYTVKDGPMICFKWLKLIVMITWEPEYKEERKPNLRLVK